MSTHTGVTEADIQQILDENEAGTASVMDAYGKAESSYFAAMRSYEPNVVTVSSTSNPLNVQRPQDA